jgi:predicted transcriptional regulator
MLAKSQDNLDDSGDLNNWQIDEIKRAVQEADRKEFASDEEVQQTFQRLTRR